MISFLMTARQCLADKGSGWELKLGNDSRTDSRDLAGEAQAEAGRSCLSCRPGPVLPAETAFRFQDEGGKRIHPQPRMQEPWFYFCSSWLTQFN